MERSKHYNPKNNKKPCPSKVRAPIKRDAANTRDSCAKRFCENTLKKAQKKVRFLSCQPTYCRNIAHESQKYTRILGANKDKKLPKFYRPTCIAPGYPMMHGKDSIPRTTHYSKDIKLHRNLSAGIHLTSGGPVWNYDKRNPPKGTWLTAPVWLETAADVYDALDYIEENESEDDSEDDSEW